MAPKPLSCYGTDPDVRLMLRTRDGDRLAFEELFRRHRRQVHGRLFQMIGDRHYAEDLTQDSFLRVYRHRWNYHPTAQFRTWLNHIVTNVGRNALRSQRRQRAVIGATADWEDHLTDARTETPLQIVSRLESQSCVQTALAHLSERQRTALTLQAFHGCSVCEIGEQLQVTCATAKNLFTRARAELCRKLEISIRYG